MLAEAEFVEDSVGVGLDDGFRALAGIEREQDCDQSFDDMRVAVALEFDYAPSPRRLVIQTWLAQPCTLFASI